LLQLPIFASFPNFSAHTAWAYFFSLDRKETNLLSKHERKKQYSFSIEYLVRYKGKLSENLALALA
jgi:hypothetical protein